jgi:hypothetical protein
MSDNNEMSDVRIRAIEDLDNALLSLTALCQDSLTIPDAVFTGLRFFSYMAYDCAPSYESADELIDMSKEAGFERHVERDEYEAEEAYRNKELRAVK